MKDRLIVLGILAVLSLFVAAWIACAPTKAAGTPTVEVAPAPLPGYTCFVVKDYAGAAGSRVIAGLSCVKD